MAANAALRPFQRSARSASSFATRTSRIRFSRPTAMTGSVSASTSARGPSSSTSSTDPASVG